MIFYHLTPTRNLARIQRDGLLPRVGHRSRQAAEPVPTIYLFPSMDLLEGAFAGDFGDAFAESTALTLLEVDLPAGTPVKRVAWEIQVFTPIAPGSLKVLSRNWGV